MMRCRTAIKAGWFLWAGVLGPSLRAAAVEPERSPARSSLSQTAEVAAAEPLDLNTASATQLRALPGMGNAYVRRILEGRPFTAKNQLLTRGILPPEAYAAIRERVVAHRPPRQP